MNNIAKRLYVLIVADICQLPMGSGGCFAPSYLFYFNFAKKRCEIFVYGGCGGNENAFATFDECINACSRHMEKPQGITCTP